MREPTLKLYGRLLGFMRPHLLSFSTSVLLMVGFAAFSGFSLAMIVPFTEIVLSGRTPEAAAPETSSSGPAASLTPPEETVRPAEGADGAAALGSPEAGTGAAASDSAGGEGIAGLDLKKDVEARFYNLIHGETREATLRRFCLALFIIFLVKNLFWYGQSYLIVRVEQSVIRDIRDAVFGHYQALSMDFFAGTNTGTLISRVTNDIDLVKGAIANGVADLVRQSLLLLVYLVTVLLASWQLFLFAILILPPNLWLIDRIGQTLRRSSRVSQAKMAKITAILGETLGAMRIVKAFGLEKERVRRFGAETDDYSTTMVRMTRIGSLASPLTEVLGVLVAVLILWYAGSRVATGGTGAGRFLLFIVGMLSMMQPIKVLSQLNVRIQQGLAAARRIYEVLDTPTTVAEPASPHPIDGFHREIRMEGVDFAYRPGLPVLKGINLSIREGEVLALVGPSGGGKSTLVDLIPRFHDPTSGRITLDGVDLRDLRLADLRALLGLVTQETMLFEGSVRHNIEMGHLGASREEVEEAAAAANAREFIEKLPEGYDTWIGERGLLLSGGQRQRLAIARAILKNPGILIFDEATSALDTESEALVQAAIDNLLRSRTAVVIAHRLSTVRHADRIVVIDQGRILEEGRHEELLKLDGLYRRLYEMQFRDTPRSGTGPTDAVAH